MVDSRPERQRLPNRWRKKRPPRNAGSGDRASTAPGRALLETILRDCGIALEHAQLDLLWRYHQMLRQANPELNLTRIHNFENMVLKHYADSFLVLKFTELPSPLVDMGSGPGLPGIPLKIARPDVQIVLAEPRGARAEFLRGVTAKLGLGGVEVYAHKLGADYPGQVAGVISRAVGAIPQTLDRVAALLVPGGRMIFMKGPECDAEISEALVSHTDQFRLAADHAYTIGSTNHRRRLVIFERLQAELAGAGRRPASVARAPANADFAGVTRDITSAANSTFQRCLDLLGGPGIRKHGEAIVSGSRLCAEVIARFPDEAVGWLSRPDGPPPPRPSITWLRLGGDLFRQLDVAGTHSPLLLVKVPQIRTWSDEDDWPDGCTLFVPLQDPENVGAVIRSAAAFGVKRVVLLREAAHPFHPRSSRAAGPALFQVELLHGPSLQELRASTIPLIALDNSGSELSDSPFPDHFGLVVGAEGPGLPPHLRERQRRRIAIEPSVESLNAAAAVAIALYVWASERRSLADQRHPQSNSGASADSAIP
jgi:16S rRNA (guanine527-N7)-methyltransferase